MKIDLKEEKFSLLMIFTGRSEDNWALLYAQQLASANGRIVYLLIFSHLLLKFRGWVGGDLQPGTDLPRGNKATIWFHAARPNGTSGAKNHIERHYVNAQ